MARIYARATHSAPPIDAALLATLRDLPDDFWVFIGPEFNRPVDLLIIRTVAEAQTEVRSTLICTTVWSAPRALYGKEDGPWSEQVGVEWRPLPALPFGELNPYRLALEAANAARAWLYNNQRIIMAADELRPQGEFKLWPDLLLLSPAGTHHRLPLSPTKRYGQWFTDLETWQAHLLNWEPKIGPALREEEVRAIAMLLNMEPVLAPVLTPVAAHSAPSLQPAPTEETAAQRAAPAECTAPDLPVDVEAVLTWLQGLEARIQRMEETLNRLESTVAGRAMTGEVGSAIALLGSLLAGANSQRGH